MGLATSAVFKFCSSDLAPSLPIGLFDEPLRLWTAKTAVNDLNAVFSEEMFEYMPKLTPCIT